MVGWGGLLAALMIVPKALSGVSYDLVVSKPCAIVVQESKFVWGKNIGSRMSV